MKIKIKANESTFADIKMTMENPLIKVTSETLAPTEGTYSWTGSRVPYLEAKKELFKKISNHKFESVRNWASSQIYFLDNEIGIERNRDAELFL